ncbi:hypothetical protein ACI2OW_24740 [Pseudomonas shirazica]|nr:MULTISPECIES: hypothetical protein [Pseudomonas]MDY4312788.1 hypothetical protein [Pseudomonas putida]MBF8789512.1 hypothetical protein [Pseudomonas asiatica]MDY4322400.1 hypothetical protein [Pseudomonas putida]MDY4355476.1 hypothetical protein [Pseudomonas putida]WIV23864.1 hypothetical protein QN085_24905 [Pseudomonas sp. M2(2023)]
MSEEACRDDGSNTVVGLIRLGGECVERGLNETVEVIGMSILLVWMMIGVSLMIYLACRYLDLIESELSGCSYVRDNQLNFSSAGFLGRLLRTCLASNMLMMPGIFVRRGVADASEISRFPRRIKIKMLISWGGLMASTILFFVLHNILKF